LKHKLQENKNIEELLNAKLGTLELNYKHKEQILLDLQKEYDQLCIFSILNQILNPLV